MYGIQIIHIKCIQDGVKSPYICKHHKICNLGLGDGKQFTPKYRKIRADIFCDSFEDK